MFLLYRGTDSPIVNILTLRRDLYFVMSLLLADKEVVEVPNVIVWTKAFHEDEVGRLMLWIAVAMRGLLDLLSKKETYFSEKYCGEYWADLEDNKEIALTFRQACNSVIHAKEILPYRIPSPDSKGTVRQIYADRITIRSAYRSKKTHAQLDIIKFVQIADTLINFFGDDDHANR